MIDPKVANALYYAAIVLFTVVIAVALIFLFTSDDTTPFRSNFDNEEYAVRSGPTDAKQQASNSLALLNAKVDTLIKYMVANQIPNEVIATRLQHRWQKVRFRETASNDNSVAFTINKGSEIRLCLRDPKDGSFEDLNTSMFVLLHELAHLASLSFGHNEEFMNAFYIIAHTATQLGLYKPEDFAHHAKNYCGIAITTSPCQHAGQGYC